MVPPCELVSGLTDVALSHHVEKTRMASGERAYPPLLAQLMAGPFRDRVMLAGPYDDDEATGDTSVYLDEGYTSMTRDVRRNRVYRLAIAAAASEGLLGFLEVGPGGDACLTKMVLGEAGAWVVGVEGNKWAAESARTQLRGLYGAEGPRWRIVTGHSSNRTPTMDEALHGRDFDVLLQEVLGYIASREGVVATLADLQGRMSPLPKRLLPGAVATFFTPALVSLEDIRRNLQGSASLYCGPNYLLACRVPLDKTAPWRSRGAPVCGCLEFINFAQPLTRGAPQLRQERTAAFAVPVSAKAGVQVNSLVVFIWAGFAGAPPRRFEPETGFPYGCAELAEADAAAWTGCLSFSSACAASDARAEASNWPNVVLLLDTPLTVPPGGRLEVLSVADLRGATCTYEWRVRVVGATGSSSSGSSAACSGDAGAWQVLSLDSRDVNFFSLDGEESETESDEAAAVYGCGQSREVDMPLTCHRGRGSGRGRGGRATAAICLGGAEPGAWRRFLPLRPELRRPVDMALAGQHCSSASSSCSPVFSACDARLPAGAPAAHAVVVGMTGRARSRSRSRSRERAVEGSDSSLSTTRFHAAADDCGSDARRGSRGRP
jgi:hypothetical protein